MSQITTPPPGTPVPAPPVPVTPAAVTPAPIEDGHLAPRPTRRTVAMRTFIPWQIVRFIVINLRMMVIITKSHD